MHVRLSVCLSVCLFVCLSVCLSVLGCPVGCGQSRGSSGPRVGDELAGGGGAASVQTQLCGQPGGREDAELSDTGEGRGRWVGQSG